MHTAYCEYIESSIAFLFPLPILKHLPPHFSNSHDTLIRVHVCVCAWMPSIYTHHHVTSTQHHDACRHWFHVLTGAHSSLSHLCYTFTPGDSRERTKPKLKRPLQPSSPFWLCSFIAAAVLNHNNHGYWNNVLLLFNYDGQMFKSRLSGKGGCPYILLLQRPLACFGVCLF